MSDTITLCSQIYFSLQWQQPQQNKSGCCPLTFTLITDARVRVFSRLANTHLQIESAYLLTCIVQYIKCSVTCLCWVLKPLCVFACCSMCIYCVFRCCITLAQQLTLHFTQRPVSLHWTVKCSSFLLPRPNGSLTGVKTVADTRASPLLNLGFSFSAPYRYKSSRVIITAGNGKYRITGAILNLLIVCMFSCGTLAGCSFHGFLFRCHDVRAGGLWDHGCRSKNQ